MHLRILSAVLVLFGSASGLRAQVPAAIPPVTGLAHVAYRVADLDREEAFLRKLGFERSFALTGKDGRLTESFVKINDRTFLEVYPQTSPAQELGWLHVCYESPDLTAYATAIGGKSGIKPLAVHKAGAGNLITAFPDPDGRNTEFTQYLPGSKHMNDAGQHLLPNRIAEAVAGIEFGAPDMQRSRSFYEAMGMHVSERPSGLHVQISQADVPWIELSPAGSTPKLYLQVRSLNKAAAQLKAAGIAFQKTKESVAIQDPEGNQMVFVEAK